MPYSALRPLDNGFLCAILLVSPTMSTPNVTRNLKSLPGHHAQVCGDMPFGFAGQTDEDAVIRTVQEVEGVMRTADADVDASQTSKVMHHYWSTSGRAEPLRCDV